ncbi:MAG TPA: zinc ribbon domain-containing protein [Thermoanaerobaculia bacterium]|nr:zinc ribbon domain-containing protein [Thermoanaerobaculia bacterium]
MPLYEYRCRECGNRFEVLQRLGQGAEGLACPKCGAQQLEKQYSTFASAGGTAQGGSAAGGCGPGGFS